VSSAAIQYVPKNTIKVEQDHAKTLLNLIDALEELDDTQHVYANFEMDDAVMEAVR
jgi:transcriptional/translational regulatory protein YebC/TACO1